MISRNIFGLLFLFLVTDTKAQQQNTDSLRHELGITQNDTVKIVLLTNLTEAFKETESDSSIYFAKELLTLSRKLNFKLNEANALSQMGYALVNKGEYPKSLKTLFEARAIGENSTSEQNILPIKYIDQKEFLIHPATARMLRLSVLARAHQFLGILFYNTFKYDSAKSNYLQALQFANPAHNIPALVTTYITLGILYIAQKKPDSALICEQKAKELSLDNNFKKYLGSIFLNFGLVYSNLNEKQMAASYFHKAIDVSMEGNYISGVASGNHWLAEIYKSLGNKDSTILYARAGLQTAKYLNAPRLLLRAYKDMAGYYRSVRDNDSLVKYLELINIMNDSIFSAKQTQQFDNIGFDEKQRQLQIEADESAYRSQFRIYALLAGLAGFLVIAIILWRANQHRKKANTLLSRQKEELQSTLNTLKTTQDQLIQSEKMASLGELTAGIAHEIQNPLNFVNNFSEINRELIEELEQEIDNGDFLEAKSISQSIKDNEEKINHHGKRADAIVKGMLQHSRSGTGQRMATDINALAGEYLRLCNHGFRTKDTFFNAMIRTDFDESIGKINIVPQDFSCVLLNLFNNAFYAVAEKKNQLIEGYNPIISVSTKKMADKIEIHVTDNGNGIPPKVLNKIFQPFFTTKPTGQGTGLGLSLSYDIIKAHGGELKVESREGEGAEFVIQIPAI